MLLRKSGYVFHTSAEKEVVRMIKEKTGYVALDPKREEKEWAQLGSRGVGEGKVVEYTLPDGSKIKVHMDVFVEMVWMLISSRLEQRGIAPLRSCSTPKS